MKKILYILLVAVAASVALSSCINDDFDTTGTGLLTFSTDTVAFDTVMTGQGTATKQFVIYNKSDKQVRISSLKVAGLASGAKFYLNVDGEKGSEFRDVEIRGKDSIYVFVEAYLNENTTSELNHVLDRIDMVVNGTTQSVVLSAWGQNFKRLARDTIKEDTRLTADRPYVVYDTLTVMPGVTLTIDPGVTLYFHDKAALVSLGTVKAVGTHDKPIVMRGDRLDHVVGQISFDIMSGQWGGVQLYGPGNVFEYVDIHSSSSGLVVMSSDPAVQSLYMLNCVLHNSSSYGFMSFNAWVEAYGTEFSDAPKGVAYFEGGKLRCVNCTFANYYLFEAVDGANIILFDQDEEKTYQRLDAVLANCISYGLGYDINDVASSDKIVTTNIYFYNTLFKSSGEDDTHFFNNVWAGDPKFYVDRDNYVFDYRLNDESDAIGKADRTLIPEAARYDRYGQDRFAREAVDLGAYVWVPAPAQDGNKLKSH